jgi:glycerophosphoryl diester phosphodiesterase
MHDATVDRTTNGSGRVAVLSLAELRKLDAGSWKSSRFQTEQIPTLDEALAVLPVNIWINVHLKGDEELARKAARQLAVDRRLQQSFLACDQALAAAAREVVPDIAICNMDRQQTSEQYVKATIESGARFIQFLGSRPTAVDQIGLLHEHQIRVNFCCSNSPETLRKLFEAGVNFVLVDRLDEMLRAAEQAGVERLTPEFRDE